ncbi:hypothetical protein KIW84_021582 [Lathyrus oleraceus]|uniref:Gag-pol polyprotein n=1 Tax=Pisum sativum TaxID=3888 RepID=A0A9D4Y9E9_PEA|nr:hypothetical protein KIW84_021582 [Pisum sativum]
MNCKEDVMSNVLVDIGYSLNVLPKSTLSRLSYQGALMRYSGVIIKAFNGSQKTVIGEVDLPVKIGPSHYQITFQVMDIHPAYSYLLGRTWIHETGAVTSTLHQKLKFVKNGKLVVVGGENTLLVSHMSSFSYVEAEEEVRTPFQALSIAEVKKTRAPMSSLKDAQKAIEETDDEEVSDELSRIVEHEEKAIQPFEEQIELVNLGSEDDVEEDMPGLDSEIVEHRLPLKPECPPVKQKLRRTHPDMEVKIKEEVQKQIDVGFLVTAEYP